MGDGVEVLRQVGVDHVGLSGSQGLMHFSKGLDRTVSRAISMGVWREVRLEDRLQDELCRGLYGPILHGGNAEGTLSLATGLGDHHSPHRLGSVDFFL